MTKQILTYTATSRFLTCPRSYYWRYVRCLVKADRPAALRLGSVIHNCLSMWHENSIISDVLSAIDQFNPDKSFNEVQRSEWHLATAMMKAYSERYQSEDFSVLFLERQFRGRIMNPATKRSSRRFDFAGKADGVVEQDGKYFIIEHKTASRVDSGYIEHLWLDLQIFLYAIYAECSLLPVSGIIYNILPKSKLTQSAGETEEDYRIRCEMLIAKSKHGKTSAKRKIAETDEEFQSRLAEWYSRPGAFHRELILVDRGRLGEVQRELWSIVQAIIFAHKNGFYQNTDQCFKYGRPCPYFAICKSDGNPNIIDNLYHHEEPHTELSEDQTDSGNPTSEGECNESSD